MTTKDPVCGMSVEEAPSTTQARHQERTFYFCSEGCRKKFEAAPERFLAEPRGAPAQKAK